MSELSNRLREFVEKCSKHPWELRFGGREEDSGFCIASRIGNNVVCERWPALGATEYNKADCDLILELSHNLEAIISALETVEGIEGIYTKFGGIEICPVARGQGDYGINWFFTTDDPEDFVMQGVSAPTLHAAVMAAVEKAREE